jgi:hypothetical protein
VKWIEQLPERLSQSARPLQEVLTMLLLPEEQLPDCAKAIRAGATRIGLAA